MFNKNSNGKIGIIQQIPKLASAANYLLPVATDITDNCTLY
ncbi:MAG: hypothetical protein JWN78_2380 [Bacteroidota bacterium]|nr:hypothetical protein [Bacteroidota bacterium]